MLPDTCILSRWNCYPLDTSDSAAFIYLPFVVGPVSRAAAKHTTVAERKCTTGVMPEGADLGVGVATGTVVGGPWEDYGPACSGAEDSVAFCRLPLRR